MLLKIFSFICTVIILAGCIQRKSNKQEKAGPLPKPTEPETIEITDSMNFDNYNVEADTAYFFATADPTARLDTYMTKDHWTVICKIKGDYGYSVLVTDSVTYLRGWLELKNLRKILFTPPKIANE